MRTIPRTGTSRALLAVLRRRPARRRHWSSAQTLAELGELTARYLEGAVDESPTHLGPPDPETASIRDRLAALNRSGLLVTYGSQPGEIDERGRQRAFVEFFCTETTADEVDAVCGEAGLGVLCHAPGSHPSRPCRTVTVPVTEDHDGRVYTDVGGWMPPGDVAAFHRAAGCTRQVVDALLSCWQVSVYDPVWGRADLLWDVLADALDATGVTA